MDPEQLSHSHHEWTFAGKKNSYMLMQCHTIVLNVLSKAKKMEKNIKFMKDKETHT